MKTMIAALLMLFYFVSAVPSFAQNQGPKIAVLNVFEAIVESSEGKLAFADFQKKFEAKREELNSKQKELEELQNQLRTQQTTLNDAAKAQLARNIDMKTTDLQRATEDAEKEFNTLRSEIYARIGNKLAPVVEQYAKENTLTLILDSSNQANQVIFSDPAIDITNDIIKRFDTSQTSSTAPAPTPASSTAPAKKAN